MRDFFRILGDDREASRNLITERRRGARSQEQSEEEECSTLAMEDAACLVARDLEVLFKSMRAHNPESLQVPEHQRQ